MGTGNATVFALLIVVMYLVAGFAVSAILGAGAKGIADAGVAINAAVESQSLLFDGEAVAVVTDIQEHTYERVTVRYYTRLMGSRRVQSTQNVTEYIITVEFDVEGESIVTQLTSSMGRHLAAGSSVRIRYMSSEPDKVMFN
jgi:hypothetical protein